ncbi:hypothetical protein ACFQ2B_16745 [Streptomyces stramineus]
MSRSRHRRGRRSLAEFDGAALYDTVILVPARNEEVGVLTSLDSLARQSGAPISSSWWSTTRPTGPRSSRGSSRTTRARRRPSS